MYGFLGAKAPLGLAHVKIIEYGKSFKTASLVRPNRRVVALLEIVRNCSGLYNTE